MVMPADYPLLVFDFDGTLADSFPFFLDALDTLADAHGFRRIDRAQLDTLRTLDARAMLRHVGLPLWKAPRVAAHFKQLMTRQAQDIALFDGVPAMLTNLHAQRYRLAVLTSNSEANVRIVLGEQHAALFEAFECGSALFGKHEKLKRLLRRCAVNPEQVLCIGDELRDLEAARRIGTAFAAVGWGYMQADALRAAGPDYFFATPAALAAALLTPAARHTHCAPDAQ